MFFLDWADPPMLIGKGLVKSIDRGKRWASTGGRRLHGSLCRSPCCFAQYCIYLACADASVLGVCQHELDNCPFKRTALDLGWTQDVKVVAHCQGHLQSNSFASKDMWMIRERQSSEHHPYNRLCVIPVAIADID